MSTDRSGDFETHPVGTAKELEVLRRLYAAAAAFSTADWNAAGATERACALDYEIHAAQVFYAANVRSGS